LASLFEPYFQATALASVGAGGIIAFLIINLLHLTHGEQTPTYLGVERSKFVVRHGATPLYWFAKLIGPIIAVGDSVAKATLKLFGVEMIGAWLDAGTDSIETRADLRHELGSVLDRGNVPEERREEILNALAVGERPVRSVMTPADDIVFLSTEESIEENLRRIGDNPHTRLPLIGSEPSEFRGIVYVPSVIDRVDDLRGGTATLADVAAPPMTISDATPISEAVDQFQIERQELALVVDDGEVAGLLTATDAFEAVMGDLEDPLDVEGGTNRATGAVS
jgi:CBS domain containing-hemolysin-like protein